MNWLRRLLGLRERLDVDNIVAQARKAWALTPGDKIVPLPLPTPSNKVQRFPLDQDVLAARAMYRAASDAYGRGVRPVLLHSYQKDQQGREKRN